MEDLVNTLFERNAANQAEYRLQRKREKEEAERRKEARHHENVGLKKQLLDILRKAFHQED